MSDHAVVVRTRRLRAARGVVVARNVALTAAPGEVVAVEGPNGSGKSTLLAAAAGLLPTGSASVRPGSVGYSPERAGVLPRVPLHRWLLGLARTAGLDRDESARRTGLACPAGQRRRGRPGPSPQRRRRRRPGRPAGAAGRRPRRPPPTPPGPRPAGSAPTQRSCWPAARRRASVIMAELGDEG